MKENFIILDKHDIDFVKKIKNYFSLENYTILEFSNKKNFEDGKIWLHHNYESLKEIRKHFIYGTRSGKIYPYSHNYIAIKLKDVLSNIDKTNKINVQNLFKTCKCHIIKPKEIYTLIEKANLVTTDIIIEEKGTKEQKKSKQQNPIWSADGMLLNEDIPIEEIGEFYRYKGDFYKTKEKKE